MAVQIVRVEGNSISKLLWNKMEETRIAIEGISVVQQWETNNVAIRVEKNLYKECLVFGRSLGN